MQLRFGSGVTTYSMTDWERIGGAPNHYPDATSGSESDGYQVDDVIDEDAADYERVLSDATSEDSDVVWTGDGSSTPSTDDNATGGSSSSNSSSATNNEVVQRTASALGVEPSTALMVLAALGLGGAALYKRGEG